METAFVASPCPHASASELWSLPLQWAPTRRQAQIPHLQCRKPGPVWICQHLRMCCHAALGPRLQNQADEPAAVQKRSKFLDVSGEYWVFACFYLHASRSFMDFMEQTPHCPATTAPESPSVRSFKFVTSFAFGCTRRRWIGSKSVMPSSRNWGFNHQQQGDEWEFELMFTHGCID